MRVEPHTGIVTIDIGGEAIALCFTWRVLAAFRGQFGEGWDTELERAMETRDPVVLAGFLALATDKPVDWWLDRRGAPPMVPVIRALQAALMVAYFGPGGAPADPQTATAKTATVATFWRRLFGRGDRPAATPSPSGA